MRHQGRAERRRTADQADFQAVLETVESLRMEIRGLAALIASSRHSHTGLLVGWPAISRYVKKGARTLRRYRKLAAFPAHRWGRHVVAAASHIDAWLAIYAKARQGYREAGKTDAGR